MLFLLGIFLNTASILATQAAAGEARLRIGLLAQPESLNFFSATDVWSRKVLRFFQMPLFVAAPDTGEIMPWLAASLPEITHDPYAVTIRLREAFWDDGSPVTAGDLAFTVRAIQEFRVPAHVEQWQMVEKIEVLDSKTIRFILSGPSPEFLNRTLYTSFVQEKEWAPVIRRARTSDDPLAELLRFRPKRPAGNGPFSLSRYSPPYFMILKKNPRFFAAGLELSGVLLGPHLDELVLDFHPTAQAALGALTRGEIDFFWGDVPLDAIESLQQEPGVSLFTTEPTGYEYLVCNLGKGPLKDGTFRRAVALLIDREHIVEQVLAGRGEPVYQVIPPWDKVWANPRAASEGKGLSRKERLEAARKLLGEGGYSWKNGALILPGGKAMPHLEMLTTCAGYRPYRLEAALLIRQWLGDIGVTADVRMRPLGTVLQRLKAKSYDLALLGWGRLPNDPGYLSAFFGSRQAGPGGRNYSGFRNTDFDALADQAAREMDVRKRQTLVHRMQDIIVREAPSIPLYAPHIIEAANGRRFTGWVKRPGGIGNLWTFLGLKAQPEVQQGTVKGAAP